MKLRFPFITPHLATLSLAATLLVLGGTTALSQTWTGAGGNWNWSNPGNWNPSVPGPGGNVFIGEAAFTPVDLDVDATIGSLTLGYATISGDNRLGSSLRNFTVDGTTTIREFNGKYKGGFNAYSGANYRRAEPSLQGTLAIPASPQN